MRLLAQQICCRVLGIDPKTLRRWTSLAQIPFLKSPLDARLRCLTPAHLQYLATIHDRPLDASLLSDECPPVHQPQIVANSAPESQESAASLAHMQQIIETLQHQLTQLALDLLQERTRREEQEQKARQLLLSSQPRAFKEPSRQEASIQEPSQKGPSPRKGRPRSQIPLIAAQPDGTYLIISPEHGELPIPPESRQWFAWLDSLSSFRFLGQHGRLSTHRQHGRSSWIAYRRLHGQVTCFSLGPTNQLTIAHLEHMAALLQTPASQSPS